jgi:plastocyanin
VGRRLVALLVLVALAAAAAALAAPAAPQATKLLGKVGPGFSISLMNESGTPVTTLPAGDYTITIDDQSAEHNFHLYGPGFDRFTEVDFVGTATWEVTLRDGTYTVQCDPHAASMRRSVAVGAAPAATTTAAPSAPGTLVGTVGPAPTISLTRAGRAAKTLKPGAYTVTVRDRSASHNFHLTGAGVNRKTAVPFVGTQTWKVTLKRGTLRFLCDPHKSVMRGAAVVR